MSRDKSKEMVDYLTTWLSRHKTAADIAPGVQREKERAEWQHETWSAVSSSAPEEVRRKVEEGFELAIKQLKSDLPLPPEYDPSVLPTISTTVTGSSMSVYTSVFTTYHLEQTSSDDVEPYLISYQILNEAHNRPKEVRNLLEQKFSVLVPLFDRALAAFETAKSQPDQIPAAALELRTLIDKFQGELFDRARQRPREDMKWETMAERLGTTPNPDAARKAIHGQLIDRTTIYARLSSLAKRRREEGLAELNALLPLVLDHLLVVAGSINKAA